MNEKWTYFLAGLISATIIYVIIILSIVFVDIKAEKKRSIYIPIKEIGSFKCEEIDNIKNTFDNNVVIINNNLYNINLDMIYSNEENCLKMSDINIIKAIDNYYIGDDNKIYTLDASGLKEFTISGHIPTYMFNEDVLMASSYGNSNEYKYYVLKNDGKIYDVVFQRKFNFLSGFGTYSFDIVSEEVYKELENENIKYFDTNNNKINYLVTDKGVYTNKISNNDCKIYADVECIYELTKNDILEESMDNIKYINLYNDEIKYVANDKAYRIDA